MALLVTFKTNFLIMDILGLYTGKYCNESMFSGVRLDSFWLGVALWLIESRPANSTSGEMDK